MRDGFATLAAFDAAPDLVLHVVTEISTLLCGCVRTCDADGLFSRPLLVRLSRPLSEEKRPFFRCLQVWDNERLLSVASSLEQI